MNKIPIFLHIPKNAGTYVLSITMTLFRHYAIKKNWNAGISYLNLRRILLQKNGTQIATLFVCDPEEVRNAKNFEQHNTHQYCNIVDVELFSTEIKNGKLLLFSIIIEDNGIKLIKNGFFDSLCNQNNLIPVYYTILRDPFDRCQSLYNYITSSSSIHEPTHGKIQFKTFEEYLSSNQLEDSWLIRNLINIPDSREITEEDFWQSCFILNQFKIKDINNVDLLFNQVFNECYGIDQSVVPIKYNYGEINKNSTFKKNKCSFNELDEKTKTYFLKRTEFDIKLYKKYIFNI